MSYPGYGRDPLDSPLILLEDSKLLISKTHMFDSEDFSLINIFPEPIYAASSELNLAIGKNGAYYLNNTLNVDSTIFDFANFNIQNMQFKGNELFSFHKEGNYFLIDRLNILKKASPRT